MVPGDPTLSDSKDDLPGELPRDVHAEESSPAEVSSGPEPEPRAQSGRVAFPRIRGYRIESVVGRGATGVVYSAIQLAVDRPVAVKVLHEELVGTGRAVRRLQREARTAARLAHPGIISAIDMGEQEGRWWYAMELVEGISLAERIDERGALTEREALRLFCPLCDALQHLSEGGVVHRDIKPANILIDQHGRARLVDLGLAFAEDDPSITRSGGTLGTPHYMSPEQARDATSADQRSDIWSLGATLYHALCGRPPFEGESVGEILSGVLYGRVTEPRRLAPNISRGLSLVLRKCLANDPERRYAEPALLLADLERLRERRSPAVQPATLDPVATDRPAWWRPVLWGGAALAASTAVLLGFWRPWESEAPTRNPGPASAAHWSPLEDLDEAYGKGLFTQAEALEELALLPQPPVGWAQPEVQFHRRVLSDLEGSLGELERDGTGRLDAWLIRHEYDDARAYLDAEVILALRQSTGFDDPQILPAGRLSNRFNQWLVGQRRRLDSTRNAALAAAREALDQHLKASVFPAFEAALENNQWATALAIVTSSADWFVGVGADLRGLTSAEVQSLLEEVRSDLDARRSTARNHFLRVDGKLTGFLSEEADLLRARISEGGISRPGAELEAAYEAETRRLGMVPEQIPAAWTRERGHPVGSGALLIEMSARLAAEERAQLAATARAAFIEDSKGVRDLCVARRYGEAATLLEGHLAEPWRGAVHGEMKALREECELLQGLLVRTEEVLRTRRRSVFNPTFDGIPYEGAVINTVEDALERGFELEPRGIPPFRVHLVRGRPLARGDRVLETWDLLWLAKLGEQEVGLTPDERLLRSLFLFHEGRFDEAARDLPRVGVRNAELLTSLADRLRLATERVLSEQDARRVAVVNRLVALRTSYYQKGNPESILKDIGDLVRDSADLLTEEEHSELRLMISELENPRETASLTGAFGPGTLAYLDRLGVRMTWDFGRRETGAWRSGDWLLFAGGLQPPRPRSTDAEFWDPMHALHLALTEPLDLNRPLTLRLRLRSIRPGRQLRNEVVIGVAGLSLVFEDDSNRPAFVAGRGDPAGLLKQVREGPVNGFSGFEGFPRGEGPFDLVIEVHPKLGRLTVQVAGVPLKMRDLTRGSLPANPTLSLRSREAIEVLSVTIEAQRLVDRR